jgi:hypothetical protein
MYITQYVQAKTNNLLSISINAEIGQRLVSIILFGLLSQIVHKYNFHVVLHNAKSHHITSIEINVSSSGIVNTTVHTVLSHSNN